MPRPILGPDLFLWLLRRIRVGFLTFLCYLPLWHLEETYGLLLWIMLFFFICPFLIFHLKIIIDPQEVAKIFHSLLIFHPVFFIDDNMYICSTTSDPGNWYACTNVEVTEQLFSCHRVLRTIICVCISVCIPFFSIVETVDCECAVSHCISQTRSTFLMLLCLMPFYPNIFLISFLNLSQSSKHSKILLIIKW